MFESMNVSFSWSLACLVWLRFTSIPSQVMSQCPNSLCTYVYDFTKLTSDTYIRLYPNCQITFFTNSLRGSGKNLSNNSTNSQTVFIAKCLIFLSRLDMSITAMIQEFDTNWLEPVNETILYSYLCLFYSMDVPLWIYFFVMVCLC